MKIFRKKNASYSSPLEKGGMKGGFKSHSNSLFTKEGGKMLFFLFAILIPLTASAFSISITAGNAGTGLIGHWELSESAENRGSEIVINGNAESYTGTLDDGITDDFPNWTEEIDSTGTIEATVSAHSGGTAIKMLKNGSWTNFVQILSVTAGKSYQMNMWIKGDSGQDISWGIYDYTNATWIRSVATSPTGTSWEQLQYTFTAPAGCTQISFYAIATHATNYVYIDDVSIKEIQAGNTVPGGTGGSIYGPTYTAGPKQNVLGPNLVRNGTFDTDSEWTKNTGWTISGGTANYDGSGGTVSIVQNSLLTAGVQYVMSFDVISNEGTGGNSVFLGSSNQISGDHLDPGSHTFTGISDGTVIHIYGRTDENFVIDNVVIREVILGGAMSFDGVDDYVATTLNVAGQKGLTAAGWFYKTDSDIATVFGSYTNSSDMSFDMDLDPDRSVEFNMKGENGSRVDLNTAAGLFELNTWVHVVSTWDGAMMRIYVDGTEVASKANVDTSLEQTVTVPLVLGSYRTTGQSFGGKMQDVRIYDRALSAREIKRLYDGGDAGLSTGTSQKGLVGHWPLNKKSVQSDSRSLDNSSSGTSYTTSPQAYGTWEFDMYKESDFNSIFVGFLGSNISTPSYLDGGVFTGYGLIVYEDERVYFQKHTNGSYPQLFHTRADYITLNTWYRFKITRSLAGVFTVYIKGGVYGDIDGSTWTLVDVTGGLGTNPVTDNINTTSTYMVTYLDPGDKIRNIHTDNGFVSVDTFTDSTGTTAVSGNKVIADTTPNANIGTVYGADIRNHGYSFDGTDCISASSSLPPTTGTVSIWFNADSIPNYGTNVWDNAGFFGKSNINANIGLDDATSKIRIFYSGPDSRSSVTTVSLNQWYLATYTYSSSGSKLYVNGTLDTDFGAWTWSTGLINNFAIGCGHGDASGHYFDGNLADARVYDRELSATEIVNLYNGNDVSSPVAHWPLETGLGDISGNGYHGSLGTGEPTLVGEAASFDGVDDYITTGVLLNSSNSFTLSGWAKTTDKSLQQAFIGGADRITTNRSYVGLRSGNYWMGLGDTQRYTVAADAITNNVWFHFTLVTNGSNASYYVNGVLVDTTSYTGLGAQLTDANFIGGINSLGTPGSFFNGQMADTRIYNRALSAAEISTLYSEDHFAEKNASTTSLNKGLVGHWPLTEEALKEDNRSLDNSSAGASYVSSTQAYGTWEFDFYKGTQANFVFNYFINADTTISGGTSDGYEIYFNDAERIWFSKKVAGVETTLVKTASSYISNSTWYRLKVTRSTAGVFTMYIKGGVYGDIDGSTWTTVDVTGGAGTNPFTDTTHTTSAYMVADLDVGDKIRNVHTDNGFFAPTEFTDGTGTTSVVGNVTIADTTPNENIGTIYGADTRNHGYSFDGTNDYVDCGDTFSSVFDGSFSISIWTKPTDGQPAVESSFYGHADSGTTTRMYLDLQSSGVLRGKYRVDGVQAIFKTASAVFPDGSTTWKHITIVGDSTVGGPGGFKIYVDGELQTLDATENGDTTGITFANYSVNRNLALAAYSDGTIGDFHDGSIAETRIYDRALSASEIMSMYHGTDIANPVGHWPLEKNATDFSGNNNHGTVIGATLVGEGTSFDGVDDYVDVGDSSNWDIGTGNYSINMWVNPSQITANTNRLISSWDGGVGFGTYAITQFVFTLQDDGKIFGNFGDGSTWYSGALETLTGVITTNQWSNIQFIFDATLIKIYANGVLQASVARPTLQSSQKIQIGGWAWDIPNGGTNRYFDGSIADVRIYHRALSLKEIQMLYNQGRP